MAKVPSSADECSSISSGWVSLTAMTAQCVLWRCPESDDKASAAESASKSSLSSFARLLRSLTDWKSPVRRVSISCSAPRLLSPLTNRNPNRMVFCCDGGVDSNW